MPKQTFTILEIRNYLNTHNTLSEALEFLTPEDIEAAQEEFDEDHLDELIGEDDNDFIIS